jgi:hypothetical protein
VFVRREAETDVKTGNKGKLNKLNTKEAEVEHFFVNV